MICLLHDHLVGVPAVFGVLVRFIGGRTREEIVTCYVTCLVICLNLGRNWRISEFDRRRDGAKPGCLCLLVVCVLVSRLEIET